jgi:hypothetical protein
MLIVDKRWRLGVWYRKRLAESEATAVAMIRVAWGWHSCSCRPDCWALTFVPRVSCRGLPQSYLNPTISHVSCTASSLTGGTGFPSFSLFDSLIFMRAICLIVLGHYQPRGARGVCISTWGLRSLGEWEAALKTHLPNTFRNLESRYITEDFYHDQGSECRGKGRRMLCMALQVGR